MLKVNVFQMVIPKRPKEIEEKRETETEKKGHKETEIF